MHVADPEPQTCPLPAPPRGLTRFERGELLAILLLIPALYLALGELSWSPRVGALAAYGAGLLLGQGLVRDLVRLVLEGRQQPTVTLRCMCAETTIGVAVLLGGLGLLLLGIEQSVTLGGGGVTAGIAGVLLAGFAVKDYVLVVRKVKDHGRVRVG